MGGFENIKVASANQMQAELARIHNENLDNFIETKAEEFRAIVDAHPEFLEDYPNHPEEVLKKIDPLLYH